MNKFDKLYFPSSILPTFDYKHRVGINWFRAGLKRDGIQYGNIIKGYNDMTRKDRRQNEFFINILFTSDEVESLTHFLRVELDKGLYVSYEFDPTQPIILKQKFYGPVRDTDSDTTGLIFLNRLENYNLPFEVRGIFDKSQGTPVLKHLTPDKLMKPVKMD